MPLIVVAGMRATPCGSQYTTFRLLHHNVYRTHSSPMGEAEDIFGEAVASVLSGYPVNQEMIIFMG